MKLSDYMIAHNLSRAEFAKRIGTSAEAVRRYETEGRVPTPKIMAKIALATGCQVTANDFFGIEASGSRDDERRDSGTALNARRHASGGARD